MTDFNQNFENIPSVEESSPKKKLILGKRKLFFLGLLFLLFILILGILVLLRLFFGFKKNVPSSPLVITTPTPTPIFSEEIKSQSLWATDSGILKIEEELKNIEKDLDNTDIKEKRLMPPVLDWEIKF
jgi:hypothetical protein